MIVGFGFVLVAQAFGARREAVESRYEARIGALRHKYTLLSKVVPYMAALEAAIKVREWNWIGSGSVGWGGGGHVWVNVRVCSCSLFFAVLRYPVCAGVPSFVCRRTSHERTFFHDPAVACVTPLWPA